MIPMGPDLTKAALAAFAVLLIAACEPKQEQAAEPETAEEAVETVSAAAAALGHPDRMMDDNARDQLRKAEETLAFLGVAPGMTVFEIEAGGGYYTELFSRVVGADGVVVMQNPESFLSFVGDEVNARLADNRLANVRQSFSLFDAFDAEDGSVDLVTWVQGPHELYYKPEDGGGFGDPTASYAEIFRILKPGGVFAVIDHSAIEGSPETTGNELHRIDKAIVIALAQAAGFELEAEANFLANPDDDRTLLVFDPEIRGNTDQFALRFRKPE
jgi:predicted methyltransferase